MNHWLCVISDNYDYRHIVIEVRQIMPFINNSTISILLKVFLGQFQMAQIWWQAGWDSDFYEYQDNNFNYLVPLVISNFQSSGNIYSMSGLLTQYIIIIEMFCSASTYPPLYNFLIHNIFQHLDFPSINLLSMLKLWL